MLPFLTNLCGFAAARCFETSLKRIEKLLLLIHMNTKFYKAHLYGPGFQIAHLLHNYSFNVVNFVLLLLLYTY
ncbi:hypothetical protein CCR75_006863 [Bremia lactucae]|uniref:Uncharacterized protein n=1 Tax=Bremia lactucae TaxID=4779 RepID=A0A976FDF1_BRELC|nr:hypothetical protein CCR75_006863 [Bremia lactucae]